MGVESSLLLPERVLPRLLCFIGFGYLRLVERWIALLPFFMITLLVDFLSYESMMSMPLESSFIGSIWGARSLWVIFFSLAVFSSNYESFNDL